MEKTPIIGRPAKAKEIHQFRESKLELKAIGYPHKETKALVEEYLKKVEDKFVGHIGKETLLIKVPSGSGENKLTGYFAQALQERFGARVLSDGLIFKKHKIEAKAALSLDKRITDPIGYSIDAPQIRKEIQGAKNVLIIDDLIGTGESSIKLKKVLEANNLPVQGLLNLITVENRYPTINDLNRVMGKISAHKAMTTGEKENFWKDLQTVFGDYTRQKINRVERIIGSELAAVGAYEVIRKAARIEREVGKEIQKQVQYNIEL